MKNKVNSTQKYTFLTIVGLGLLVIMLILFSSGPGSYDAPVEDIDSSRDPGSFFAKASELQDASSEDRNLYKSAVKNKDVSLCDDISSSEVKRKCLLRFYNSSQVSEMISPSSEVEVVVAESNTSFFQTALFAVLAFLLVFGVLSYHHIHMYRQETHAIHNHVLVRHIKHELKSGVPHHEIKKRLLHVGWKLESVEKAFKEALKRL